MAEADGSDDAESTAARSPREVVAELHAALIASMKAGVEAGFEQRREQLEPVVRSSFDFPTISRLVLGVHWPELSETQQQRFIETMRELTVTTYAHRFRRYSGQSFTIEAVESRPPRVAIVRARFTGGNKARQFDYQLVRTADRWRIVNVAVDGVSDLSVKRAQYVDVMERRGFEELMERLGKTIEERKLGEAEEPEAGGTDEASGSAGDGDE